ncbi:tetratricopeptide repeat protein [Chitinophaga sp. GCM10012297]|uniref:Tetratricopeptide repeat protein n=1 Tax=Chitinophaga chungangae TaxID=2821488 RepID=A0ABS3YBF4_9BACT|nr:tetratricopeptide repeat protein [Chitinophaga chungangae]MBO9152016.1 tetratricopeptide repeat protein [Chitinophaga chungangae]
MHDQLFQRAILLMQQKKYREAQTILSSMLEQDPQNPDILSLFCEVKIQLDDFDSAMQLVNHAIGIAPADARLFYQRARIYLQREEYTPAETDLGHAITLDPYDADYFALYAMMQNSRKRFEHALQLSEQALEIDPENIYALNARSTALLKLNRKEESFAGIEGAFRQDPHNAYTHANYGWGLLEKGSPKEALNHFREALRIDPSLQLAQAGMMEALKARYLVYRLFLKYAFFMGNLTAKYQWGVIIGLYLVLRLLNTLGNNNPALQPYVMPIVILLSLFAFSTWIITPLSNLFLRFNPFGKHLLDKDEITSSNHVAISFLVGIAGVVGFLVTWEEPWIWLAIFGITMMIPLSVRLMPSRNPLVMTLYTLGLGIAGLLAIVFAFAGHPGNLFGIIYVGGMLVFQWVVNYMSIKRSNR